MRSILWLGVVVGLGACAGGGADEAEETEGDQAAAEGSIVYESETLTFAESVSFEQDGHRYVIVGQEGSGLTCEWANSSYNTQGGPNVNRSMGDWKDLFWGDDFVDEITVRYTKRDALGSESGPLDTLDGEVVTETAEALAGTMTMAEGEVSFHAPDCGVIP